MKTLYLYRSYKVGDKVRINGVTYQIVGKGKSTDCLPGGIGICEYFVRMDFS